MSVIQARPVGPLDIAGDIHGEYEALVNLLGHLGAGQSHHPQERTPGICGDFCDRAVDHLCR